MCGMPYAVRGISPGQPPPPDSPPPCSSDVTAAAAGRAEAADEITLGARITIPAHAAATPPLQLRSDQRQAALIPAPLRRLRMPQTQAHRRCRSHAASRNRNVTTEPPAAGVVTRAIDPPAHGPPERGLRGSCAHAPGINFVSM